MPCCITDLQYCAVLLFCSTMLYELAKRDNERVLSCGTPNVKV